MSTKYKYKELITVVLFAYRERGSAALVHCRRGISRSASTVRAAPTEIINNYSPKAR